MTALTDLIAQLRQNESSSSVQAIRAQVELLISALNFLATGGGVTLAGDVTGAANANTVGKILGNAVLAGAPSDGQGYVWNAAASQFQLQQLGLLNVQLFAASGTYTPTAGTKAIRVRFFGAGGGGGGAVASAANITLATSASGGSYSEGFLSGIGALTTGAVTIGAGGNGGLATGTDGTDGGTSSFVMGTLNLSIPGGLHGSGDAVGGTTGIAANGAAAPANASGGYFNAVGGLASPSVRVNGTLAFTGDPGSCFGAGRSIRGAIPNGTGANGSTGSGGSAGCSNSATGRGGGAGANAFCLVEEFG